MLATVTLVGACSSGPVTLQSQSTSQPPSVDGALSEWGGSLVRVGDRPVSMSVLPTDSLLYVALSVRGGKLLRSVAKRGFTVWVDPAGGQRHTYGVRYPIGLPAQRKEQKTTDDEAPGSSKRSALLEQVFPSDLAVIRNDTLRRRLPARFSSGLRVDATLSTGSLIYEIAIPISPTPSDTTAAGERPGLHTSLNGPIGVGVEIPENDDDTDLAQQPSGIPSVTGRRGRNRRPGRRRGQRPPPSKQQSKLPTLSLWTQVVPAEQQ